MPTSHIWIGGAPAKAQVESITFPDDVEAGQTISFAIGVKTLEVPLTASTRDDIIDEVVTAWNASIIPEVSELTAAALKDDEGNHTGVMTLTVKEPGKRFAVTTSIGSGNNEIQVITLSGTTATGGTFTLTFDEETTGTIAYNASAATIKSALELLPTVNTVTVTGSGPWSVEFTGTHAGTNVSLMTIDTSGLTGGVNEVQTITSPSNPTGGTFTLTFGGETTAGIAYNASAATIEAALNHLTTIPTGSVSCAGGALPTAVTVTFLDEFASTDVELLEVDSSGLTGVTGSAVETAAGGSDLQEKCTHYWNFSDENVVSNYSHKNMVIDTAETRLDIPIAGGNGRIAVVEGGKIGKGLENASAQAGMSEPRLLNYGEDEDFSISVWVKFTALASGVPTHIMSSMNTNTVEWALSLNSDGTISFQRVGNPTDYNQATSGTVSINTWHHITAVWDWTNKYIRISLDGAAFDQTAITNTMGQNPISYQYFKVGGYQVVNSLNGIMNGFIDSIGAFSTALTIAEVATLYNSGAGEDYPFSTAGSNEVQTLTLTGSPSAGSVTVSYQGVGVDIPYDATASEAEALLDTVSTIGTGNVNVTGGPWPGTALVVEFINDLAVTNVELLDIDTSALVMLMTETTKGVTDPVGSVVTTVTPLTQSTTTASEGPNDWSIAANWNTNMVPVTGDTVYISDTDTSILYGLDQSAVTLAALHIEQTFTGFIGLPRTNSDGTGSYTEYRDQYLKIGATLLDIGDKEGNGSDRIKIDLGSVQGTVLITDSGSGEDENTPAILLLGTHGSNVIDINRGSVGIAFYPTEVSTFPTIRQAFFDDATSDTTVYLGDGVTLTDIIKTGGTLDINSATTSFTQDAGETTIHAGAHASLNVNDGVLNYNSTGTLTAASLAGEAVLNFNQDRRPKTVTTITKKSEESEIFDDSGCITAPIVVMQNVKNLGQLHFSNNFTVTLS